MCIVFQPSFLESHASQEQSLKNVWLNEGFENPADNLHPCMAASSADIAVAQQYLNT